MSKIYSRKEEKLNVISHGLGAFFSVIGLVLLIIKGMGQSTLHLIAYVVFGLSMIVLYTASTLYHATIEPTKRAKLRIADHIGIYFLIAGSYTPFCLITLRDSVGIQLFIAIWLMALIGTVFKFFFTGKFEKISTAAYVLMGWSAIFAINPLINNLPPEALKWLTIGGAGYTIGAVLYSIKKLPLNHAIFHIAVMIGTFSHFMAVYLYL